jgi:hypothetical protein
VAVAEIVADGTPGEYPAGGGSGGGVFLHADSVSVTGQADLELYGGGYGFGAGGLGEVEVMANSFNLSDSNIGGDIITMGFLPEPSSLVLLASVLPVGAFYALRRPAGAGRVR